MAVTPCCLLTRAPSEMVLVLVAARVGAPGISPSARSRIRASVAPAEGGARHSTKTCLVVRQLKVLGYSCLRLLRDPWQADFKDTVTGGGDLHPLETSRKVCFPLVEEREWHSDSTSDQEGARMGCLICRFSRDGRGERDLTLVHFHTMVWLCISNNPKLVTQEGGDAFQGEVTNKEASEEAVVARKRVTAKF
eukprot:6458311-Amphidinium_carterae.2